MKQDKVNALWEVWMEYAARYGYNSPLTKDAYSRYKRSVTR